MSGTNSEKRPFFSVLMPAYNATGFIEKTLNSVLNQSFTDYEIIIVDDGSKDDTRGVVGEFIKGSHTDKIHYYWQKNGGASSARWLCGQKATGKYLAFLDADDHWYPDKLQTVYDEINKGDYEVYYHDELEIQLDGEKKNLLWRQIDNEDAVADLVLKGNALSTSATVVEKTIFDKTDPFKDKKRAGEDYECWIRLAKQGARFKHIDKVLGEYRRTETSLTKVDTKYVRESDREILGFYDYLDPVKYSKAEVRNLKRKRKALNDYLLGRDCCKNGDFANARKYLFKSMREGNRTPRCILAICTAILHIRR